MQDYILNLVYPIGSIYISINSINPNTFLGGTWEEFGKGKTLVGVDEDDSDFASVENTGGEKNHTLTKAELPNYDLYNASHSHSITDPGHKHYVGNSINYASGYIAFSTRGNTTDTTNPTTTVKTGISIQNTTIKVSSGGSGNAMNNLQPYITVYMYKRTA